MSKFFNNVEIKYLQKALIEEELYHDFNYEFLLSYIEEFTKKNKDDYTSLLRNNNIIILVNQLFYKNLEAGSNLLYRIIVYLFNKYFDIDITNQNKTNCIDIVAYKFSSKRYNIVYENMKDIIEEIIDMLNIPNVKKEEIIENISNDLYYISEIDEVKDIFIDNNYPFNYNNFAEIIDEEYIFIRDLKKNNYFQEIKNSKGNIGNTPKSKRNRPETTFKIEDEYTSNKITNKDELKLGILTNKQSINLFELCDCNIFEGSSFENFVLSFNNPEKFNLTVLKGSKNKLYVLLGWLNSFYKTSRNEHTFKILEQIKIDKEDYYKKKPNEDGTNLTKPQSKLNDNITEIWELNE